MDDANESDKTIVFCATQEHAAMVRDLINQNKKHSTNIDYCVRVTANDGEIGENALRLFQDNEKSIPTVLTTSQKLSTGVDARNVRNIVLMRPVNQIIEFKQIVGRGTRTFDGKDYFTIYDFVDAHQRFLDPEWDGEPEEPVEKEYPPSPPEMETTLKEPKEYKKSDKVRIKLKSGRELSIQHTTQTMFWDADGKPVSTEDFLNKLFGDLPALFKSEEELIKLWSNPNTRRTLLSDLDAAGYDTERLNALRRLIDAENSDLFDVLDYVFNSDSKPITRATRVAAAESRIFALLNPKEREFIEFVLSKYIEVGVEELDTSKLSLLLTSMYQSQKDGISSLGGDASQIKGMFESFQRYLYQAG